MGLALAPAAPSDRRCLAIKSSRRSAMPLNGEAFSAGGAPARELGAPLPGQPEQRLPCVQARAAGHGGAAERRHPERLVDRVHLRHAAHLACKTSKTAVNALVARKATRANRKKSHIPLSIISGRTSHGSIPRSRRCATLRLSSPSRSAARSLAFPSSHSSEAEDYDELAPTATRGFAAASLPLDIERHPTVVLTDCDALTRQVFVHEEVHELMRLAVGTSPRWLNEGFSEYFSALRARA
jgi:hypothetical protein